MAGWLDGRGWPWDGIVFLGGRGLLIRDERGEARPPVPTGKTSGVDGHKYGHMMPVRRRRVVGGRIPNAALSLSKKRLSSLFLYDEVCGGPAFIPSCLCPGVWRRGRMV